MSDTRDVLRDEADLIWFFNEGQSVVEGSNFGRMLEHAELFGHRSLRCGGCSGNGILSTPKSDAQFAALRILRTTDGCEDGADRPCCPGDWCPTCDGTGHVFYKGKPSDEPLTAKPMGNEVRWAGHELDHAKLSRLARVSRRLGAVERESQALFAVLAAHYGPAGQRCAAHGQYGRLIAVMAGTVQGRKVIAASPGRKQPRDSRLWERDERADDRILLAEIISESGRTTQGRGQLLAQALAAAERLVANATKAWVGAKK